MIGIVVVSHSPKVSEGIAAMARDMAGDDLQIFTTGGGPDGSIGTVPDRIASTIREADERVSDVLVVADLGSAILNIEVASEQVGVDVRIVDCPVVEGTLSAAIEATKPDATVESVTNAAEEAWNIEKGVDR